MDRVTQEGQESKGNPQINI